MGYAVLGLAKLALAAYQDRPPKVDDWQPIVPAYGRPGSHGFFAVLYRQAEQRWVFAIRGTDDVRYDVLEDLNIFLGAASAQVGQARQSLQRARLMHVKHDKLCLTGHSLGGGLAALLAAETGLRCVTFNAPGTARAYGDAFADRYFALPLVSQMLALTAPYAAYTGRILNIRASGDIVSVGTGPRLGHVETIGVHGCEPVPGSVVSPGYPPRRRANGSFGAPSLEWHTTSALTRMATYNLCQHRMDLMVKELERRPEYRRDLQW